MSPEYKVYIPEESEHYLLSFLKHVKGASFEPRKARIKASERPKRDPDANLRLAGAARDLLEELPDSIGLFELSYTHRDRPDLDIPDNWKNFRQSLQAGDKLVLSNALSRIRQFVGWDATLGDLRTTDFKELEKSRKFSSKMLQFIKVAFSKENL